MGGSAFSSKGIALHVPRMPPAVYSQVKAACHARLRDLFVYVATPIEGPEKKDHGDIDVLVALERPVVFPSTTYGARIQRPPRDMMAVVEKSLGAEHSIIDPAGGSANLAIPWPSKPDSGTENTHSGQEKDEDEDEDTKAAYVQIDIRICRDVDHLCWCLFKHAHGDIWNLLGSTIRPFGLTVDEDALWLRIPEIEKIDRKQAKVQLSRDPAEILYFLGMKVEGFWAEPFDSVEALFAYVTTCRLFSVPDESDADGEPGDETASAGVIVGDEGRKKLKANDRRRMNGRPVYRRWINEFIPQLRAERRFAPEGLARNLQEARSTVRDEAFASFFVRGEYTRRLRDWEVKKSADEVKKLIKTLIPDDLDHQYRSCLVSAMRKIVMADSHDFGDIAPSVPFQDSERIYNLAAVRLFVEHRWKELGRMAWSRQMEKAHQNMLLKKQGRLAAQSHKSLGD
ncbi:hypothetical protein B0T24DRAFT_588525 [Lasiosphaeria ovina]|uniref:Uncharacterized protein n=1 Tax=Lasiosphaeria ovina TaxID=92902 RepID=A0AAE0NLZ2_9PEZI|nr:hypothetical protein B0T24DRAFT_588525 [Lasiosphaeria ovina]